MLGVPSKYRIRSMRRAVVPPVLAHLGVDEVLVDGGQLGGQHLVEQLDDVGVALHGPRLGLRTGADAMIRPG
jgi:hypothetical protein